MFGFSISVQAASLLGGIIDPIVKYIIGNYVSLSIVTYYEVARRFSTAVSGLFNTAFKTILPKSSILKNKLEYSNFIKNEGIKLTKIGVSYSGFIFGCLSLFFVLLIKIWFGYEQSILIFFILGLAESVNIAGYMIFSFFMGIGKSVYLVFLQGLFLALVYIILIMGFTIFHNLLGLIGFFVASFLVNTIQLFLLKDQTGVSILYYLKKTNMIKLISLHLLILMSIILTFNHVTNVYITFGILSLISSRLFIKEIKDYGKQVLSLSRNSFGKMMQ
jgi:O-antigen/teichoic acid export membrane protein